jgi:hypothetical protein
MNESDKFKMPNVSKKQTTVSKKPNIYKNQTTVMPASKETTQNPQQQKKGCGCGGSERANVVRRVINTKRKG